jgi:hypothetical protein
LTLGAAPCNVRTMNSPVTHVEELMNSVGDTAPMTCGFWFYFGFYYASPAMLVELESIST